MTGLAIQLMGPFYVTLGGQPVTSFEYDKVRALLAYLAVEQERPHRREALAGMLWPDLAEEAAESNLRNALSRLRRAINDPYADPPYLISNREEIQFNSTSDHWLDVRRFYTLFDACQSHAHRRIEACSTCTGRLLEASNLYRGEILEGFSLPDSNLFEDWVRNQRDEQKELALRVLHTLALTYERRGELEKALQYTRRQLRLEPCLERAYVHAMKLYATLGMRAEACAQYAKCRKVLADEIEVEPAEETTYLYEQIKYGLFQPSRGQLFQVNNLPTNLTSFVGREQELKEIRALTEDLACRLLTLVGPGGVGKTRLAITAASQLLATFAHGACFVSLQGVASVEGIVPAIFQALEHKPASSSDLKKSLLDYLREKELMLVLDNFEHLLDGAGLITEMLQAAPGIMVLVTSRQRLGLQAEWIFEVSGLSYPCGKEARELTSYEAVKLFTQRLHQLKPRQVIFQDDLASVSRICRLVEGLPLGIELAASAAKQKTIEQVAEGIESGKEELESSWVDIPERHRSIRAVFEHSYRMLKEDEQSAFIGLGVFRSGFSAEAAEQVAGATPVILNTLVEHSLVRHDTSQDWYNLHPLIHQFIYAKLIKTSKANQEVPRRHSRYYLQVLKNWEIQLIGPEQAIALNMMDLQLADIRTAWNWACQIRDINGLELGSEGLCLYYQYSSRFLEGNLDCRAALDALEAKEDLDRQSLRIKVHLQVYQGSFVYRSGKMTLDELMELLNRCLLMLDDLHLSDEDVRVDKAWMVRLMSEHTPDSDKALHLAQESLHLAYQTSNKRTQALALSLITKHFLWLGKFKDAEHYCEASLTEWRVLGDPRVLSEQLQRMSEITGLLGKTKVCMQAAQERKQLLYSLGDRISVGECLRGMATSYYLCDQWAQADKCHQESLPYLLDSGDQIHLCNTYANWGRVKLYTSQYDAAWNMAMNNIDLAQQLDYVYSITQSLFTFGAVDLAKGQYDQSIDHLEEAARICAQGRIGFLAGDVISTLSISLLASGQEAYGQKRMVEGLKVGVDTHNNVVIGFALPSVAYFLAINGEIERAVELLGLINDKAWCGKSPWLEDVVGKKIKELAEGLPAEVRQAALERGKKLDLFETAAELQEEFQRIEQPAEELVSL